jgi:hypothetical protein
MGVVSWSDERAGEEEAYAFGVLACLWARPFVQHEHRSIGTTTDGLRYHEDGSITIQIQN